MRLAKNNKSSQSSLNLMRANNPSVIPRNHIMEQVLEDATNGDLKPLNDFLTALETPYKNRPDLKPYQSPPKQEEAVYQTFCGT